MFRPAAAAVKAQDELAALGLDGCLASSNRIFSYPEQRRFQKITTSTTFRLTPTGILMEEAP